MSRIPRSAATIIPFDEQARIEVLRERQAVPEGQGARPLTANGREHRAGLPCGRASRPIAAADPATARPRWRAGSTAVEIRPVEHSCVLACLVTDATGEITALFYGRTHIPGVEPGSKIQLRGRVGIQRAPARS